MRPIRRCNSSVWSRTPGAPRSWPKQPGGPKPITDRSVHALVRGEALPPATLATVHELAAEYRFFHWHLEFPHLFRAGGPFANDRAGAAASTSFSATPHGNA